MTEFLNKQLARTSVRHYNSNKKIEKEKIILLKKAINSVATSINGQTFSAIFINDELVKEKISKLNWNQKHIVDAPLFILFIADGNRVKYALDKEKKNYDQLNSLEHFQMN